MYLPKKGCGRELRSILHPHLDLKFIMSCTLWLVLKNDLEVCFFVLFLTIFLLKIKTGWCDMWAHRIKEVLLSIEPRERGGCMGKAQVICAVCTITASHGNTFFSVHSFDRDHQDHVTSVMHPYFP